MSSKRYNRLEKIYEKFMEEDSNTPAFDRLLMISKTLYPLLHELTHKSYAEAVLRRINRGESAIDEA